MTVKVSIIMVSIDRTVGLFQVLQVCSMKWRMTFICQRLVFEPLQTLSEGIWQLLPHIFYSSDALPVA